MTHKIFDTKSQKSMTHAQEERLIQAFEKFHPSDVTEIPTVMGGRLTHNFDKKFCCGHVWKQVPIDEGAVEFLKKKFDEQELGDEQKICIHCEALSLWENGQLFAYDAITPEQEAQEKEREKQERPARRGNDRKR